jgi:hypothetical protein
MNSCSLCLNKTLKKNSVSFDKIQECELTVEEIMKEHFWFFEVSKKIVHVWFHPNKFQFSQR